MHARVHGLLLDGTPFVYFVACNGSSLVTIKPIHVIAYFSGRLDEVVDEVRFELSATLLR